MLLERRILHRDVSLGNIMFDHAGGMGNTGRLIDFDLAKRIAAEDQSSRTPGDFRTVCSVLACHAIRRPAHALPQGTRMYQSYKLLIGSTEDSPDLRPHDYLDDLESFFYVLCHVCFLYKNGEPIASFSTHETLAEWNSGNTKFKGYFLSRNISTLSPDLENGKFSKAMYNLLDRLRCMFQSVAQAVDMATRNRPPVPMECPSNHLEYEISAREAYREFLGYIDTGITLMEEVDVIGTSTCTPIISFSTTVPLALTGLDSQSSQPIPSSSQLFPPAGRHVSSSSSHGSKRRLSATSLSDAEQDREGGSNHSSRYDSKSGSRDGRQKDRKRTKGK